MDSGLEPFSQSLSLSGAGIKPTPDSSQSQTKQDFLPMLGLVFLGYDLEAYAKKLAELNDGLPLPQVFSWEEPEAVEHQLRLEPEDIKTVLVFEQILQQKRKSGKHYQAMKELSERHPAPELEMLLITYLTQWLPNEAESRFHQQLEAHSDWLLLRSLWSTRLMMEAPPELMPAALAAFKERMQNKFELHEHVSGPVAADLVNTFYYATALYFLNSNQPERCLYSINVLERTGPRQSALKLLEKLLLQIDSNGQRDQLQDFVAPFRAEKMRDLKDRVK